MNDKQMDLTCFNASKPFAQNATLLYDDNKNDVNLWKKNGTASLPQCSEPYTFLSQCLLCLLLDSVYVVCNNLTDPVKVKLEYPSDEIPIVKSECPRVQIADSKDRIGAASGELGTAAIICIVLAILAIIAAVFLYRRLQQSRRDRNSRTATGPSSSTDINLCDTQVQRVGNGLQEADERLLPTNNNNTVNGAPSTTMLCDDKSVCDTQV